MAYRDQLKAAQTRVAQLEAQLAELVAKSERKPSPVATHSRSSLELTRELAKLKKESAERIAELEAAAGANTVRKLEERNQELEQRIAGHKERYEHLNRRFERAQLALEEGGAMIGVTEHNSAYPWYGSTGALAGVLCSTCLSAGVRTELRRVEVEYRGPFGSDATCVSCARCLYVGWMRVGRP